MKVLLVNGSITEMRGGTESAYLNMGRIFGKDAKLVSYSTAASALSAPVIDVSKGHPFDMYFSIDQYLSYYEKLNDVDLIIREAGVGGFMNLETPQITTNGNPYHTLYIRGITNGMISRLAGMDIAMKTYLQKRCGDMAKVNVALSNFMIKDMAAIGIKNNVEVIVLGTDTDLYKDMNDKQGLRDKYGIPKDMKVGMWVGSYTPVKGYHIVENLVDVMKDVFWILVFKFENEVMNVTPKSGNVKLFANIDAQKMIELYNCADFLLTPSIVEGCGNSNLEAMCCDIPLVTINSGAIWEHQKDILAKRDFGISVNAWNSQSFMDGIKMLEGNEFGPRKYIMDNGLDLVSWRAKWMELAKRVIG